LPYYFARIFFLGASFLPGTSHFFRFLSQDLFCLASFFVIFYLFFFGIITLSQPSFSLTAAGLQFFPTSPLLLLPIFPLFSTLRWVRCYNLLLFFVLARSLFSFYNRLLLYFFSSLVPFSPSCPMGLLSRLRMFHFPWASYPLREGSSPLTSSCARKRQHSLAACRGSSAYVFPPFPVWCFVLLRLAFWIFREIYSLLSRLANFDRGDFSRFFFFTPHVP